VATGALILNARAREILGLPADSSDFTYDTWQALVHPDDRAHISEAVRLARLTASKSFNSEYRMRHTNGHYVWINMRAETVEQDEQGHASRVMGTFRDISYQVRAEHELKRANEQLLALSVTDALTGVGNRRLFDRELATEWARATRQEQPLALLLIDIDYFKRYNDYYGHQAGDDCLRQVAQLLANATQRSTELLTRYGGEEFAILMSHPSGAETAEMMAQRCIERVANAAIPHANSQVATTVTLSIGVVWRLPKVGETVAEFVRAADEALYAAKADGRARYRVHM
jgi:diguanylate cyclase (GGDEF)-like protein/PAS domain S-box-containing protein